MELLVQSISQPVFEILNQSKQGQVHSVFNTSLNLIFDEHLIHIGGFENGLAPFGMAVEDGLAKLLAQHAKQGMPVRYHSGGKCLQLKNGIVLRLARAKSFEPVIKQNSLDFGRLDGYVKRIHDQFRTQNMQTGLVQDQEEQEKLLAFLRGEEEDEQFSGQIWAEPLKHLFKAAEHGHDASAAEAFDYWIGRGLGLTPSGDDMLTGFIASFDLLDTGKAFADNLHHYLEQKGRMRTTPVAFEYLSYAVRGYYHTSILHLAEALQQDDVKRFDKALYEMKQVGHTSGVDTVIGILAGIRTGRKMLSHDAASSTGDEQQ